LHSSEVEQVHPIARLEIPAEQEETHLLVDAVSHALVIH
jgi:hypothetical protein